MDAHIFDSQSFIFLQNFSISPKNSGKPAFKFATIVGH